MTRTNTNDESGSDDAQDHNSAFNGVRDMQLLWENACSVCKNFLQLSSLEIQKAGESVVILLICAIAIAVLLITAWIGLASALVLELIYFGMQPALAILVAVLLDLVLIVLLIIVMRRKSRVLHFPDTSNSLRQMQSTAKKMSPAILLLTAGIGFCWMYFKSSARKKK